MKMTLIQRAALIAIGSLTLFGCACPRGAAHFEPSANGSRQPAYQNTIEAVQCATRPSAENLILTTPVWLAAKGLYRATVPPEKRNQTY
jgi:hypothetical protein